MKDTPRRASEEDAARCAEIIYSWIDASPWMPKRFSLVELESMIRGALPIRRIWTIGTPAMGYLSFNPEAAQVMALYTASPGSGHGRALLDHLKQQEDYIQLWSHEANLAAHRFYIREGFVKAGHKDEGSDGIPEIRFEWTASTIRPPC